MKHFFWTVLLFLSGWVLAQNPDSTRAELPTLESVDSVNYQNIDSLVINEGVEIFTEISALNPNRAAIYSAALPGLGQVYNGQYWKVPIIYGGFLILGHYIRQNDRLYQSFQSALFAINDNNPDTVSELPDQFTDAVIRRQADRYRRDRDYLMIITGLFYLLNIADAHISAHLHEFTINKDLSIDLTPSLPNRLAPQSVGMALTVRF